MNTLVSVQTELIFRKAGVVNTRVLLQKHGVLPRDEGDADAAQEDGETEEAKRSAPLSTVRVMLCDGVLFRFVSLYKPV